MSEWLALIVLSVCFIKSHKIVTDPGGGVYINFLQFLSYTSCRFCSEDIGPHCHAEFYIRWLPISCNLIQDDQLFLDVHHRICISGVNPIFQYIYLSLLLVLLLLLYCHTINLWWFSFRIKWQEVLFLFPYCITICFQIRTSDVHWR